MNRSFRLALACWVLPFVAGVAIFLLWLATRKDWLMLAGVATICVGTVLFLIGGALLAREIWLAARAPQSPPHSFWYLVIACSLLLLSNFPVALGIAAGAIAIETSYTVYLQNDSDQTLTAVRLEHLENRYKIGTIPPGERVSKTFWPHKDGSLELVFQNRDGVQRHILDGYVIQGYHVSATFQPDGTVTSTPPLHGTLSSHK